MIKKRTKQKIPSLVFRLCVASPATEDIQKNVGAQVTVNQDHAGAFSAEFVSRITHPSYIRTCEHTVTPRNRVRNDFGHHFLQLESAKNAKNEPPRRAFTKLVVVLPRFCRIAPIEHISFVPESTRWKRSFDGKRGINAATSSVCTVICFPVPTNKLSTTLANSNTSIATIVT